MLTSATSLRLLIVYALVIPLAFVVGFFLIAPDSAFSVIVIGLILIGLSVPLLMKWHHPALIISCNAFINAFFLPGQPSLWILLAAVSFGFAMLDGILGKKTFARIRSLDLPLLFLGATVVFTAVYRGGFGLRSFGGTSYGGRYYFYVLASILAYYALSSRTIPKKRANLFTGLFFLSGMTAVFSNIAYAAGPSFYFLFLLFPTDLVMSEVHNDYSGVAGVTRIVGLSFAAMAVFWFLLLRYGVRGIFDMRKPWRFLILCGVGAICLLGGFRFMIVLFGLVLLFQFWYEKLFLTRYFAVLLGLVACVGIVVVGYSTKLPISMQRALSFLPIEIDPMARSDANSSLQWRLDMWNALLPDVPKYLWVGKGYGFDPTDYAITEEAVLRGFAKDYDTFIISGNYHNGPFSLVIPFGIWGTLGFIWLLIAGCRVLYRNYRYGDPQLHRINTFLLAYFVARFVFFFAFFGAFNSELIVFTSILGLSISLNGGMCSRPHPVRRSELQHDAKSSLALPNPQLA